ncbi:hypothetical protein HY972_02155, partial [Candidatus Kaiserbacteria bacterium]|nr:hypothetical protein [Candidatus Kaiserbacteria bacterium]
MNVKILAAFVVSLFFVASPAHAQMPPSPLFGDATFGGELVQGNANCFDYYHFGSIVTNLEASVNKKFFAAAGSDVVFRGMIRNTNTYPVVNVDLYVKIFRKVRDGKAVRENGYPLVDQFVAVKGLTIDGNSEQPVQFNWSIPNAIGGSDFLLATYAIVDQKYNLSGLSFTDDVTGAKAGFVIPGKPTGGVEWDKNRITMNGKQFRFAAFIPQFSATEPVTVSAPLVNSTKLGQTSTITWKQYNWDGQRESELLDTKTDTVTLKAGEKKDLTYTATKHTGPVTYLVADVETNGVHSILDMRFARQGVEQARINFPSLNSFPLKKGEETIVFSCLHSVGPNVLNDGKLTLSLTDKNGKTITEEVYEGKIGSAMMGIAKKFTPNRAYDKATLTATLSLDGKVVEENKTVYDCKDIDPAKCSKTSSVLPIAATIVAFLLAVFVFYYLRKRGRANGSVPPAPLAALFLLLVVSVAVIAPRHAEALTTSVSSPGSFASIFYDTVAKCNASVSLCDQEPVGLGHIDPNGWSEPYYTPMWGAAFSVGGITSSITYQVDAINADTGMPIQNGTNIPIGTRVQFVPKPFGGTDIFWNGTGGYNDSPYGNWGSGSPAYLTTADSVVGPVDLYVGLNVAQPSVTIAHSGTATVNCTNNGFLCTVTGAGSIISTVTFGATSGTMAGKFYKQFCTVGGVPCRASANVWYDQGWDGGHYPMQDPNKASAAGCSSQVTGSAAATCANLSSANQTVVDYPAGAIAFNFTANSVGQPTITTASFSPPGPNGNVQYSTSNTAYYVDIVAANADDVKVTCSPAGIFTGFTNASYGTNYHNSGPSDFMGTGGGTTTCTFTAYNGATVGNSLTRSLTIQPQAVGSCPLPWGGTIAGGSSVTAYQSPSVVFPAACVSQTRTCSNGTLSGSYTNQSCTVIGGGPVCAYNAATQGPLIWGGGNCSNSTISVSNIAVGQSVVVPSQTAYAGSETITCNSLGNWDGPTNVSCDLPVPTASLSATPDTINSGQSSTLKWSSTNATSCSFVGSPANGISTGGAAS